MSMTTTTSVMEDALRTRPLKGEGQNQAASKKNASERKVSDYAKRISENWRKSVGSIWSVAEDCLVAKNEFTASEKQDLIARLPFGESMFSKLASIGGDKRLKAHRDILPPSISTMDILRKLSDAQFEIARTKGLVGATREDVKQWTRGNNEKSARKTSRDLELPLALYCVYPEKLLDEDQHKQINRAIVSMAESEGLKAAVFTGENLIAQLKDFFSTVPKQGRHPSS